jgi:4-hydroxybenzoate polyprenyltransferase
MKSSSILPLIALLRPYQWVKNLLLFSGLIFSATLLNSNIVLVSLAAFAIFCTASSSIYILNDICDAESDRLHPHKKNRPIAAGRIKVSTAIFILSTLMLVSLLSAWFLDWSFFKIILLYILLNICYSFGLKKIVILDVMIVAFGFLLRVYAGCAIIHVQVSPWLFLCTLTLALIVSFGKRRNELNVLKLDSKAHRTVLQFYNLQFLDIILTISCATAIGSYSLYTMANETVARYGSQKLIFTTPFVIYGVFRYLYLIYTQNSGGDPTKLLIKDTASIINGLLWILSVLYVIYGVQLFPILSN